MPDETLTIVGVGDLLIRDHNPQYLFDSTRHVFKAADIAFCNIEQPYAWRYPDMARVFAEDAGFHVGSFANNHILDHGADIFAASIDQLEAAGIRVVGAGRAIDEARSPAIVERGGVKVAFLGYSSIQAPSYQATAARPGFAPMKAHTAYHPMFDEAPGAPPQIRTFPDEHDLAALVADVEAARAAADIVIVSIHWGPLLKGGTIDDYQRVIAHATIDAGADLIFGHHPHILKGVEIYKGRAIFYSMNHFIMKNDKPLSVDYSAHGFVTNSHVRMMLDTYPGEFGFFPDYPLYPFGPDTLDTIIVKAKVANRAIESVSYLPCRIGADCQPILLAGNDPAFGEVVDRMERYSRQMSLPAVFKRDGDEVFVSA